MEAEITLGEVRERTSRNVSASYFTARQLAVRLVREAADRGHTGVYLNPADLDMGPDCPEMLRVAGYFSDRGFVVSFRTVGYEKQLYVGW